MGMDHPDTLKLLKEPGYVCLADYVWESLGLG